LKDKIEIKDNGNGIPQKIIDKIFNLSLSPNPPDRERR
jgi:signal transduction histidine kinase